MKADYKTEDKNWHLPINEKLAGASTQVRFKKLENDAILPVCKTEGDAGFDISSVENLNIKARSSAVVPTGLAMALPMGYEAQVRSRSGLAAKHMVAVLNSPGTIDAGYRGEIKVILINHGDVDFKIEKGDRVAQLVFKKVEKVSLVEVNNLDETTRGAGGLGSTGVK